MSCRDFIFFSLLYDVLVVEDNHSLMGGSGDVFTSPGMAWPSIERSSPALFESEWTLIHCLMPWARLWFIFVHSCLPFVRLCMVPHL